MSILDDRQTLKQTALRWLHRDDFTGNDQNVFAEMAQQRIALDVRGQFNESTFILLGSTAVDGRYLLPGDYFEDRGVTADNGRGTQITLQRMSQRQLTGLPTDGAVGHGYTIISDIEPVDAIPPPDGSPVATADRANQTSEMYLNLRPWSGQDLTMNAIMVPKLMTQDTGAPSKTPILTEFGTLYLRAFLMEAHTFVQDWDNFDRVKADYQQLAAAMNRRYDRAQASPGSAVSFGRGGHACAGPVRSM